MYPIFDEIINLILYIFFLEKLLHWNILSQGGDGFGVENPPAGSDVVPLEAENSKSIENTCFATSYHSCSKEQIVDLTSLGIKEEILNNFRPKFIFTDWLVDYSPPPSAIQRLVFLFSALLI